MKYLDKLYKGSKKEYLSILENDLKNNNKKMIVTVNPETLIISNEDIEVAKILDDKDVSLVADGIVVVKASRWLNTLVEERITGVEIAEYLLEIANKFSYSMYLFGAKKEVISILKTKIETDYPNIKLLGVNDGYIKDKDKVMKKIVKLQPDICMVALGIPHQEKLIYKYLDQFKKGIFIGVGGSFDVISGTKKRAPKMFIKLNLEWLYRILKEPKRIKRFWQYNLKFLFKVIYEKYKEIINYLVVGVLTTIISLLVYYLCVLTIFNPENAILLQCANIISWIVSVTFAYITNRKYVFKSMEPNILIEGCKFYGARVVTLILDMLFMYLTVSLLGFNDKVMKLIVNILVIIGNYIISKFLVFIKKNN